MTGSELPQFRKGYKFVHDGNLHEKLVLPHCGHLPRGNNTDSNGSQTLPNLSNAQLLALLQTKPEVLTQLGITGTQYWAQMSHNGTSNICSTNYMNTSNPVAYHTTLGPHAMINTNQVHHVTTPVQPSFAGLTTQPASQPNVQPTGQSAGPTGPTALPVQETTLPHAFTGGTLHDPAFGAWNFDTGASSHLNNSVTNLSEVFNSCMYPSVSVGDGHSIPVTNTGHSILPTSVRPFHLNNVLITPHIVKNLIFVRQFIHDNNCTIEFDAFGFSVKDFMTRRVLLRCDSTRDLYPVMHPSPIPRAFLVSQQMWHQRLGHPGGDVLHRLVSNNVISCNNEKPPVLCHACQLGKHVRLPFVSSNTVVTSCFDIIHSDVWTSPIPSLSGFKYYVLFLDHYSQFVWVYPLLNKSDVWSKFVLYLVCTQFKCQICSFQCDHGGEFDNRNLHKLFTENDGTLSCYEACLVANGSTQLEGVDVDETFSPVVKLGTIQTVLSLAASRHWPIHQLDVKNAFYMRSLYGLKQTHQAWFQRFASYITRVGFSHSRCDSSLFIYRHRTDTAYFLLYVDDIVLTASSEGLLQRIIRSLRQEFAMTDLGPLNYFWVFLSRVILQVYFCLRRSMRLRFLEKAHMVNCNPSRTPVDTESKLGVDGDLVSDSTLYRSLAGSVQYLTFTRLDISYAVKQVCLHMHDPWDPHLFALKKILRSTSRYYVFLGNNLLSWSSKRQPTLSRSSTEAEYRDVANAVTETCWLRNLLRELHTPLSSATLVYCDNASAVYLSCNPVQHQRTKHIEIDIHFVHDLVAAGQVRVLHVPSRYQFEDIFTKGLSSALFEEFRSSLSVRCPPAQTVGEC
ncbi:ribonuclease H-like domain-containing protein [Tanacetum coccineum]